MRPILGYLLLLAGVAAAFAGVAALGADLRAPAPPVPPAYGKGAAASGDVFGSVLLALVSILIVSRLLGALFQRLRQPRVIGEIVAGLVLGPSLLGTLWPQGQVLLFPPEVSPFLAVLSQMGVLLFLFLVGLELDPASLRGRVHASIAVSHASIVVPFALGSSLALLLYPRYATSDVPFAVFALFLGISLSVTAFPVLARILTDRGMHKTRLGSLALTCAAVDDVTAWCLLAALVSLVQAGGGPIWKPAVLAAAYLAAMLLFVRPLVHRLVAMHGGRAFRQGLLALALAAVLLSSLATECIGVHAIFGAFVLGAVFPADAPMVREIRSRIEDFVLVLLLPVFFAHTGLRTRIGLVDGVESWVICALVIAAASVGKFGGSFVAARLSGIPAGDSARLGILMNTRGLMELVVLNLGLDLGVLSPTLFAMLVLMALVTTFATAPALHLVDRIAGPLLARENAQEGGICRSSGGG